MITFPLSTEYFLLAVIGYFAINIIGLGFLTALAIGAIRQWGQGLTIYQIPIKISQMKREMRHALPTLAVDAGLTILLLQIDLLRFSSQGTWLRTIVIFVGHFVFFEIWYYASHRLQHTKLLFPGHAVHHQTRVCNPLSHFSGSVQDRLISATGYILPHIVLAQVNLLDFRTFYLTLFVTTVGSMIMHSNIELLHGHHQRRAWWAGVISPVSSHALHHSRIHGNFGLFTPFLDRWFGTDIKDTDWLAERSVAGRPLRSLRDQSEHPKGL